MCAVRRRGEGDRRRGAPAARLGPRPRGAEPRAALVVHAPAVAPEVLDERVDLRPQRTILRAHELERREVRPRVLAVGPDPRAVARAAVVAAAHHHAKPQSLARGPARAVVNALQPGALPAEPPDDDMRVLVQNRGAIGDGRGLTFIRIPDREQHASMVAVVLDTKIPVREADGHEEAPRRVLLHDALVVERLRRAAAAEMKIQVHRPRGRESRGPGLEAPPIIFEQ
mmetsp:Transcript_14966/g.42457  ORF Transcript_14966/g.42457 Transcript_14966/m.42457 type:complete len:227 (-) Transcript_14966:254-934(-)